MRTSLARDLESRDGSISKDAGLRNAFIEKDGEWSSGALKRPGTIPSTQNYSGFQGFSGLSFTDLPYGPFTSVSDLLFTINLDGWGLFDASAIWTPSPPPGQYLMGSSPVTGNSTTSIEYFGSYYMMYDSGNWWQSYDLVSWASVGNTTGITGPEYYSSFTFWVGSDFYAFFYDPDGNSFNGAHYLLKTSNGIDWTNTGIQPWDPLCEPSDPTYDPGAFPSLIGQAYLSLLGGPVCYNDPGQANKSASLNLLTGVWTPFTSGSVQAGLGFNFTTLSQLAVALTSTYNHREAYTSADAIAWSLSSSDAAHVAAPNLIPSTKSFPLSVRAKDLIPDPYVIHTTSDAVTWSSVALDGPLSTESTGKTVVAQNGDIWVVGVGAAKETYKVVT